MDSEHNRAHSFGGLLAKHTNRNPINLAAGGISNSYILRNVLVWFADNYNPDTQDVFCLVGWTDSSRWELPLLQGQDILGNNPHIDCFNDIHNDYLSIQLGWTHSNRPEFPELDQVGMQKTYHNLIAEFPEQMEILSFNYALQLQSFLKSLNVNYVMVDTLHNFDNERLWIEPLSDLIDYDRYPNAGKPSESFYLKYREKYPNISSEYVHLGAEAHQEFFTEISNLELDI